MTLEVQDWPASEQASHRVRLDGTTWSVWRDVVLRSAGFPAEMVLAICDEPLARGTDRAESGLTDDAAYADAARRLSGAVAATVADPGFREALTWQNPGMVQRLEEWSRGQGPTRRASKDRGQELMIASYLQRYCLKNDTIGFFGPVGWASVEPGTAGLAVVPGERLIARRTTYFEVWAIDKVAAAIAGQGRVLGWLRPRRTPSAFVAGNVLHRPHRPPVVLTDAELQVLLACDGSRTISQVLVSAGLPDARAPLTRLAELGALRLDLEGPVHAWPERLLRDKLELIADPVARAAAVAPVEELVRARDEVAASTGDPAALQRALAGLAATFEEVTGSAATRNAGKMYAGRTLVYQDTVRDVRVELGAAVTTALAAPLGLVLDSVRWLVNEITDRYRVVFTELVDREAARSGGAPLPFQRLLTLAAPDMATIGRGASDIATACVAELQRRWQKVLGPPGSGRRHQVRADAIAARAAEYFPGRPVAWSGARQHSPDIMIAAASPGDVERGDFLLILGELHLATNTLDQRTFVEQHPHPARLIAAERADHGARRVVSMPAKNLPIVTSRTSPPSAILVPGQTYWSSAIIDSFDPAEPATVIPSSAMAVVRRGDDLIVQVQPSGAELDFYEVVGDMISGVFTNAFEPMAPAVHQPRITIDKLVLSRERWVFRVEDSGWAFVTDERERYGLARRWRAEHQLPEWVFYRVPVEPKPMAANFGSIVLINLLAKHIRQTEAAGYAEYSVSEMLPDLDQLWLPDREGRRYSCELRCTVFDGINEE
jgi:hypothetical protein